MIDCKDLSCQVWQITAEQEENPGRRFGCLCQTPTPHHSSDAKLEQKLHVETSSAKGVRLVLFW